MNTLSVDTTGMRELTVAETMTVAGGLNSWQIAGEVMLTGAFFRVMPPPVRIASAVVGVATYAFGSYGASAGWSGWGFGGGGSSHPSRVTGGGFRKRGAKIKFV